MFKVCLFVSKRSFVVLFCKILCVTIFYNLGIYLSCIAGTGIANIEDDQDQDQGHGQEIEIGIGSIRNALVTEILTKTKVVKVALAPIILSEMVSTKLEEAGMSKKE